MLENIVIILPRTHNHKRLLAFFVNSSGATVAFAIVLYYNIWMTIAYYSFWFPIFCGNIFLDTTNQFLPISYFLERCWGEWRSSHNTSQQWARSQSLASSYRYLVLMKSIRCIVALNKYATTNQISMWNYTIVDFPVDRVVWGIW